MGRAAETYPFPAARRQSDQQMSNVTEATKEPARSAFPFAPDSCPIPPRTDWTHERPSEPPLLLQVEGVGVLHVNAFASSGVFDGHDVLGGHVQPDPLKDFALGGDVAGLGGHRSL